MSDEQVVNEGSQEQELPTYTETEQAAIEKGWKPKEEYQGDTTKWRSAEVFLALDEPIKRIEQQSKELKRANAAIEALRTHQTKIAQVEYQRALKDLQAQRREAIVDGDHAQAFKLEDQIAEVQKEAAQVVEVKLPEQSGELHPEFQAWVSKNNWYETSKAMKAAADAIAVDYQREGFPPSEILKKVEQDIRKEFPNKFTNEKAQRSQAVESPARGGSASAGAFKLSEDERKVMNNLVKSKTMTEKEYIQSLKDLGDR